MAQHIAFMHDEPLRKAAQRVAGRIRRRAVLGADRVVAVAFPSGSAVLAAADDAAAPTRSLTSKPDTCEPSADTRPAADAHRLQNFGYCIDTIGFDRH
jgi:hypothetical protein